MTLSHLEIQLGHTAGVAAQLQSKPRTSCDGRLAVRQYPSLLTMDSNTHIYTLPHKRPRQSNTCINVKLCSMRSCHSGKPYQYHIEAGRILKCELARLAGCWGCIHLVFHGLMELFQLDVSLRSIVDFL